MLGSATSFNPTYWEWGYVHGDEHVYMFGFRYSVYHYVGDWGHVLVDFLLVCLLWSNIVSGKIYVCFQWYRNAANTIFTQTVVV
jgi:hypothetical protein